MLLSTSLCSDILISKLVCLDNIPFFLYQSQQIDGVQLFLLGFHQYPIETAYEFNELHRYKRGRLTLLITPKSMHFLTGGDQWFTIQKQEDGIKGNRNVIKKPETYK
jgi:hypothetical protein